jgi:hypothetical protein
MTRTENTPVTIKARQSSNQNSEPIDVVYSWVDDRFPGFREEWNRHAESYYDRDPLRMRDNLGLLKYGLRCIEVYAPWVRHIYIITCAPQVPYWLNTNHPKISIVHHDAFIDAEYLPTFNSFAIASFIANIPGLSQKILYINDDTLFDGPVALQDFVDSYGRLKIFPRLRWTHSPKMQHRTDVPPWSASLAYANHLLDTDFGPSKRHAINHVPLYIELKYWQEMIDRWPDDISRTRRSRFRARYNVAHGHLYPYFLLATERARMVSFYRSYRDVSFCKVSNSLVSTGLRLASLSAYRRKVVCMNDEFGAEPHPRAENLVKAFLERRYPRKSAFEV